MEGITAEQLQARIKSHLEGKAESEKALAKAHAAVELHKTHVAMYDGAIQDTAHWLTELSKAKDAPASTPVPPHAPSETP